MAVDGTYEVEVSMPGGKSPLKINLKQRGASVYGYVEGPFGKHSFDAGVIAGNDVSWAVMLKPGRKEERQPSPDNSGKGFWSRIGGFISGSLSGPSIMAIPGEERGSSGGAMPVRFRAQISGESISGEMEFGEYGTGTFNGVRTGE